MSNDYEDYGYEENDTEVKSENNNKSPLAKKILIVMLIVIAVLLILFLIKGCVNRGKDNGGGAKPIFNYEEAILRAGKTYYENNTELLPLSVGECTEVKLENLIEKGLVNPNEFEKCNGVDSYVRVCILPNGSMQYTPWLACTDKTSETEYADSKPGTMDDVVADSSYVDFEFLPQMLGDEGYELGNVEELWKNEIKYDKYKTLGVVNYYRFRDKLYTWDLTTNYYYTSKGEETDTTKVKEYFISSPASEYQRNGEKTLDAYKWYKPTTEKVYFKKNGANYPWPVSPAAGYVYNEDITDLGTTTAYYKGIPESETYKALKYYECAVDKTSSTVVYQRGVECGKGTNKEFTVQRDIVYSCSNSDMMPVRKYKTTEGANCTKMSWSRLTGNNTCDTEKNDCFKVQMYYWYKLEETSRSYYPSGAATAAGEKTYYTASPADGYIKDNASHAKAAYKWFRSQTKTSTEYTAVPPKGYAVAKKTADYKLTDWSDWTNKSVKVTDGRDREIETKTKIKLQQILGATDEAWKALTPDGAYVKLEEMIAIFRNNKFDVNSLADINNMGEIRYQTKMYVRNKKEEVK